MPQINYYRLWCKTCNEYTLHLRDWEKPKHTCRECKSVFIETPLTEIPEQKIKEQRERWSKANGAQAKSVMLKSLILGGRVATANIFGEVGSDFKVHECDAGLEDIKRANREARIRESVVQDEIRRQRREEAKRYAHLGRNDTCICGSGKKYKKCCLTRIQSYNL